MVIYTTLAVSLVINIILFIYSHNIKQLYNNQISMRLYYEKKYNSFKLRYQLLGRLDSVNINCQKLKYSKTIYIYGKGIIGQKLYSILVKNYNLTVNGFIDKTSLLEMNTHILNDKDTYIIITPIIDYYTIYNTLTKFINTENILSIDEIL